MHQLNWTFNGKEFTSNDIGPYYGFVYCITNLQNNKKYIGRKYFYSSKKKKGKRRTYIESDWKDYYSSSKKLQEDVNKLGKENFKREMLSLHSTRGDVNYWENKMLFTYNVLEEMNDIGERKYYNENIMSRYFFREKNKNTRLLCEDLNV